MDLERTKQKLRLRSGRVRRAKAPPAPLSTTHPSLATTYGPNDVKLPNGDPPAKVQAVNEEVERYNRDIGLCGLLEVQKDDVPQYRPIKQPPDTTRPATNLLDRRHPDTYRRSGMTKPVTTHHRATPIPTPHETVAEDRGISTSDIEEEDFDLRPPAPRPRPTSLERISELLFSAGHLNVLLQEPYSLTKFTRFLSRYKPEYRPLVLRYLKSQKAIKAVEYANALAEEAANNDTCDPSNAATFDNVFKETSFSVSTALVGNALPMYITYCLVGVVTESLANRIARQETPVMDCMIGGLSEAFCITDPKQDDNLIVYASEEFCRLTGYSLDDVIGRNCCFLQGSKTSQESVHRLKKAVERGEKHCETLLNYRRDGQPFINLLMIAPLHDHKGKIKYYICGHVDVSGLVERSRGLEAFERYLHLHQSYLNQGKPTSSQIKTKALAKLRELSELFDLEESAIIKSNSLAGSPMLDDETRSRGSTEWLQQRQALVNSGHFDLDVETGDDYAIDNNREMDDIGEICRLGPHGLSQNLPDVYNAYMLIRAAPSLRIVFVSTELRKWGKIVQTPFLSHVAAGATTLVELQEGFNTGKPVSAKVALMAKRGEDRDGTKISPDSDLDDGKYGKVCWVSATPLLGSDDRVGVWMVVVVEAEKERIRRSTHASNVPAKVVANTLTTSQQIPAQVKKYNVDQVSQKGLIVLANKLDDLGTRPGTPRTKLERVHQSELHEDVPAVAAQPKELDMGSTQGQLHFQSAQENGPLDSGNQDSNVGQEPHYDNTSNIRDNGQRHADTGAPSGKPDHRNYLAINPTPPLTPETARKYSPPFAFQDLTQHVTPSLQQFDLPFHDVTSTTPRFLNIQKTHEDQNDTALDDGEENDPDDPLDSENGSRHIDEGQKEKKEEKNDEKEDEKKIKESGAEHGPRTTHPPHGNSNSLIHTEYLMLQKCGGMCGRRKDSADSDWTGVDCTRSPYSVD